MSLAASNPQPGLLPRDQAAGLRSLFKRRTLRILPVLPAGDPAAQGAASALLARELAAAGQRQVILLDESGAAARPLGARPRHDLLALIEGKHEFDGHVAVAHRAQSSLRGGCRRPAPSLIAAEAAEPRRFSPASSISCRTGRYAGTSIWSARWRPPATSPWLPALAASSASLLVAGVGNNDLTAAYAAIKQAYAGAAATPAFRVLVNGRRQRAARRATGPAPRSPRRRAASWHCRSTMPATSRPPPMASCWGAPLPPRPIPKQ